MTSSNIDPKLLKKALEAARALTHKIRSNQRNLKTFGDLASYGLPLPPDTNLSAPLYPSPILSFHLVVEPLLSRFEADTPRRLQEALNTPVSRRKLVLSPPDACRKIGKYTLFREQEPVVAEVVNYLYNSNGRLALIPAGTGAGKTQIAAAIIAEALSRSAHTSLGIPFPFPVIWLTVKNAVHQTRQRLIDCGLGDHLDNDIFVWPYSALTSSFGRERLLNITTVTDPHTGVESDMIEYRPFALPVVLILDECHALARENSLRTKAIRALDAAARNFPVLNTKIIAMSATPAEKINDGRTITCLADITYQGQKITWDNFNQSFAALVANGADPNEPSKASVERLFNAWREIVFEPPYIRWPYKSINAVRLYEFRNEADRAYADAAVERYIERISQLGRDTPGDLAMQRIALGQLRKSLEPCRAELMVDDMVAEVRKGNTALCGTAFTGTIIRSLFYLLDTYGTDFTRDNVSVIWGGRGDPRPEKILSPAEILEMLSRDITVKEMRLLQKNLDWQEDRLLFGDVDADAQDARYLRLKSLGLIGVQSQEIRQREIDKFQSGQSRFCFFTMASGGTGLSLEHCDSRQSPRVGFYTPIYNAKEWVQALGRPHRRNSISDTRQYICLLADTIEQTHVAPRLDVKLRSLGAGFSVTSKDDVFNALLTLETAELRRRATTLNIRTEAQCIIDADDEATQLHTVDIHDEDDDE